jgi:hypothetical protein
MKVFASIVFLRRWALMALYLCFKFLIFDKLVLEEDVFQIEGSPLVSIIFTCCMKCLPFGLSEMHPSFENLAIISTLNLHAYLMDIHHNTSIRSMLEETPFLQHPKLTFIVV